MMKKFTKAILTIGFSLLLLLPTITLPTATVTVDAASATGYTSAEQVVYQTVKDGTKNIVLNWGAREEDCVFVSTYAKSFYTGDYTYEKLSAKSGGTAQNDAKDSALYTALQSLMSSRHTYETSYDWTRYRYRYTDCEKNNSNTISSFYSGESLSGTWDSGSTWNREHTWPKSKSLNGSPTFDKSGGEESDIIMLRPASVSENSSRGSKAYGKSTGFYNPNSESNGAYDLRGDCARIFLYVFVRWKNNAGYAWGSNGVMESMSVLLEWMEADPVDTWEMGRNDAVQSITGTRNVFVDYPEFAWKLFGKQIPQNYVSPSGGEDSTQGGGNSGSGSVQPCQHSYGNWTTTKPATATQNGEKKRTCSLCGDVQTETIPMTGTSSGGQTPPQNPPQNPPQDDPNSPHKYSDWIILKAATAWEDGKQQRTCLLCGKTETQTIPQTCQHEYTAWIVTRKPTAWKNGSQTRTCLLCGKTETQSIPKTVNGPLILGCSVGGVTLVGGGFGVYLFFKKKKLK